VPVIGTHVRPYTKHILYVHERVGLDKVWHCDNRQHHQYPSSQPSQELSHAQSDGTSWRVTKIMADYVAKVRSNTRWSGNQSMVRRMVARGCM